MNQQEVEIIKQLVQREVETILTQQRSDDSLVSDLRHPHPPGLCKQTDCTQCSQTVIEVLQQYAGELYRRGYTKGQQHMGESLTQAAQDLGLTAETQQLAGRVQQLAQGDHPPSDDLIIDGLQITL